MIRVGSLFSGYGGLDIAVQAVVGGELAWYSEIEPAACIVLAAHHPGVVNLGDITKVDWAVVEPVDILTGGYPCQPFSHAGQRKGKADERHLYPYVSAAIRALGPRLVVLENVAGHLSMGLADVIGDLASLGFDARWGVVRAADAGAPHGRARIFIVAYPSGREPQERRAGSGEEPEGQPLQRPAADSGDGAATDSHQQGPQGTDNRLDLAAERRNAGGHAAQGADGASADADVRRREQCDTGFGCVPVADAVGGDQPPADADSDGHEQARWATQAQENWSSTADSGRDRVPPPVEWGKYAAAIHRWESILGRPAPSPTVLGANGRPRLSPVFVEWMMGLDDGHVTGHGLRPAQELKLLGNGVVPLQAAMALRMLGVS